MPDTFQIRATFDRNTITIYQAYGNEIADAAIRANKLIAPFAYDRMTWIKPSLLWMMYRSDWGRSAGQERILAIRLYRKNWDAALQRAILTTPERHVYPDAGEWRRLLEKAPVTKLVRKIHLLVEQGKAPVAESFLPVVAEYPVSSEIRKVLGM